MEKKFTLETILTIITEVNLNNDFNESYKLACFIYNDPLISPLGMTWLKKDMKEHLINLYPKLENIKYVPKSEKLRNVWLNNLKKEFGNTLTITTIHTKNKKLIK